MSDPISSERCVPIAVTGLGCWYPGAKNPLQLWENILTRRLEFRKIPDCRLPNSEYCDPTGESIDHTYVQRCAVTDGFEFDWIGRRIPKSLFESTDLVHWLSLDVAEKALNDAGYTPDNMDREHTGVIVGNTLTGDITRSQTIRLRWPYVRKVLHKSCRAHGLSDDVIHALESSMETMFKSVFDPPTPDTLAGGLANTIAGRVCNYFDFHGGGYIVDGACSSSLLAVCTAARALSNGEMNVAIAGGIDVSIDPFELVGFSRAGALSRGEMNVYDKAAAGFIAGEGCGFAVLKRLEDARRDGDQVYAVLKGWGISSDGKGGIMTPSSSGQATAIRRAYVDAGYTPADLDFVEGHGTGTRVGDQIELKGIFEAQTKEAAERGQAATMRRTGMTSLKSIIGHTKAAAGIGAFIKAVMAVNRRILPPTGSCKDPNPVFHDTCTTLYPLVHGAVMNPDGVIRAGVSAMGFGGINSHVTLESGDAPSDKLQSKVDEFAMLASNQTSEVYPMAAASFEQLAVEVKNLKKTVEKISVGDLIDLSAELSMRAAHQMQLPIRAAVVAGSVDELVNTLGELETIIENDPPAPGASNHTADEAVCVSNQCDKSRIGFLFPGQGSQQILMARKLVARYGWAREMVANADNVQAAAGLPTLSQTVFVDLQRAIDKPTLVALRKELAKTEIAQVAIVTASMIYSRYLRQMGINPVACGGHSLGELTALHESGAYDFEKLLQLVSLRGRAMSAPAEQAGAMLAMFCSREQAESVISQVGGYAVLANVNSPNQVVVSGDEATIVAIMQKAPELEISTARLNVSNAFHSDFVQAAAEILRQQAPVPERPERMEIETYSCVTGQAIAPNADLREYLATQVTSSVDFVSMVQGLASTCDMLIEVGPNKVLSRLTSEILPSGGVRCLASASDPDKDCDMNRVLATAFVNGVDVQWGQLFESRIYRSFVPAEDRVFIDNPCERSIADVGEVQQFMLATAEQLASTTNSEMSDHLTGASQLSEAIENRMALPGTLSSPSQTSSGPVNRFENIAEHPSSDMMNQKPSLPPQPRALAEKPLVEKQFSQTIPIPQNKPSNPTSRHPSKTTNPTMSISSSSEQEMNDQVSVPAAMDAAVTSIASIEPDPEVEILIMEIIEERTGFPKDTLKSDLRLLDDLNMDSIKAGDIIATAARKLGALGPIDPASLADASIGDVVLAVTAAKNGEAAPVPASSSIVTANATSNISAPENAANPASAVVPMATPAPMPQTQMAGPIANAPVPMPKAQMENPVANKPVPMPPSPMAGAPAASTPVPMPQPAALAPQPMSQTLSATAPVPTPVASLPVPKPVQPEVQIQNSLAQNSSPAPIVSSSPAAVESVGSTEVASPADVPAEDDEVEDLIMEIIEERTGFPKETLNRDLRLLDDLNMDSIKAGDIIATAARKLGALGPIDPASLADASIGDVVSAVRAAKNGEPVSAAGMETTSPSSPMASATDLAPQPKAPQPIVPQPMTSVVPSSALVSSPKPMLPVPMSQPTAVAPQNETVEIAPQDDQTWTANFDIELVTHRPKATQQDISGRHFRVLYTPGDDEAFMSKLADQFHERKAAISFEPFDEQQGPVSGDAYSQGAPYYVIAILPRSGGAGSSRDKLQRMISRLRRAVSSTQFNSSPAANGICFVQFGNAQYGHPGTNDIESCTAAGFARALHLELPSLEIRIIDMADKLSHILATDFITNEVSAAGPIRDCSFDRLGRRYETRHRKVKDGDYPVKPLTLNGNDVILVTGGARGITAELALAVAQKTGANFALVGSSPHPSQSTAASAIEISANLQRFAQLPGKCEYFSCDLADPAAVKMLVANVESTIGPVTGLIHGAGRNHPKQASAPSTDEVLSEISPKVLGAMNLLEALGNRSLNCLVGLTSIIGVTGIPGNSWYAFSNETLDLILRQYAKLHPETLVRSISYSAWSDVGMGAQAQVEAALKRMGVGLIPPDKGVASFMYALEHDLADPQMILTGALGGIDTFRPSDSAVGEHGILDVQEQEPCAAACGDEQTATRPVKSSDQSRRFVGNIHSEQPGQSIVTRVMLTRQDDPYLLDHIYEGTCLFPAVLGMEAMSQVAAHLMPDPNPYVVRLQNIELARPIIVGQEGAVEIEISAQLIKQCSQTGETVVAVTTRTERTQYHFEHFACEVVFGQPVVGQKHQEEVGERLDICPERDLYTGILFQGPLFRRWRDTYFLEGNVIKFDVGHSTQTVAGEGIFGPNVEAGATVIGDPYFRDVLLQSTQPIIPQHTGLPLSIDRIEFFDPEEPDADSKSDRRLITSTLHQRAEEIGKDHIAEIIATDVNGTIRERMVGYKVKVLTIKDHFPSAVQLANLDTFEQVLLERQTKDLFDGTDGLSPVMMVRRMPELHGMNKADRRKAEKPLLTQTVHKLKLRSKGADSAAPAIGWSATGAPITLGDDHYRVSLSHDDDYCLCAANLLMSGCDIQPVTERSRVQWESLLGTHNVPLLDCLIAEGDCLHTAGTRIWSAVEAVQKSIGVAAPIPLAIQQSEDGVIALVSDQMDTNSVLVTKPIHLHRGPKRMLAVVSPTKAHSETTPNATSMVHVLSSEVWMGALAEPKKNGAATNGAAHSNGHVDRLSSDPEMPSRLEPSEPSIRSDIARRGEIREIENVKALAKWDGPRDQAVFEHRFVVTFKDTAMRGKHVQYTQYLSWMGQLRENALLYLIPNMVLKLSDGLSGMATNWTNVDIVGEAMMGDVIVARLWQVEMTDSTITLGCDFARELPDGRFERLAYTEQATTWVRLNGRNEPTKEPFPKFLLDGFTTMAPQSEREQVLPELPSSLGRLKLEQNKLEAIKPHQPVVLWPRILVLVWTIQMLSPTSIIRGIFTGNGEPATCFCSRKCHS